MSEPIILPMIPEPKRPEPCEHGYTGDERDSCACEPCVYRLELLAWLCGDPVHVSKEHPDLT